MDTLGDSIAEKGKKLQAKKKTDEPGPSKKQVQKAKVPIATPAWTHNEFFDSLDPVTYQKNSPKPCNATNVFVMKQSHLRS
ncbi:hypothetical protein EVAR_72651_1 [Eumeta japonica]|uniref:Uncharacterized protein n=1 Tax=Eumeta variegata TaxID=151549 RepID=A0A4C1SJS0_EUMVA|nr:hypothetical protein EVAR_72651_1 [Eumeta japonica]